MKGKKYIIFVLLLFFVLIVYFLTSLSSFDDVVTLNSPDQSVSYFFIQTFKFNSSLKYMLPSNDLPFIVTQSFVPRDATFYDDYIVPKNSPLNLFFYSILTYLSDITIITPIFMILVILSTYLLSKELVGKNISIVVSMVASISSFFWINTMFLISDTIFSMFFMFLGFYLVIKYRRSNLNIEFILASIFILLSLVLRPINLIYVIFMPFFFKREILKMINFKNIFFIGISYFLIITPLFILNSELYGNFYTTGYSIADDLEKVTINASGSSLFEFRFDRIYQNIENYFFPFSTFFSLVLLGIIKSYKEGGLLKSFTCYFIPTFFISFLYFGSRLVWGIDNFAMNASLLRYMLPLLMMAHIFLFYLYDTKYKGLMIPLLLFILIIGNVSLITESRGGLKDQFNTVETFKVEKQKILGLTENNSIRIWPSRVRASRATLIRPG